MPPTKYRFLNFFLDNHFSSANNFFMYFDRFLFLTIGLLINLKTPRGSEVLLVIKLFSTLANSKLPPPKSATRPSTFSNPIFTPSAAHSAS